MTEVGRKTDGRNRLDLRVEPLRNAIEVLPARQAARDSSMHPAIDNPAAHPLPSSITESSTSVVTVSHTLLRHCKDYQESWGQDSRSVFVPLDHIVSNLEWPASSCRERFAAAQIQRILVKERECGVSRVDNAASCKTSQRADLLCLAVR